MIDLSHCRVALELISLNLSEALGLFQLFIYLLLFGGVFVKNSG